jgi:hypothetical protein
VRIHRHQFFLGLAVTMILGGSVLHSPASENACASAHERWGEAFRVLSGSVQQLKAAKEATLPFDAEKASAQSQEGESIARAVQTAMKERGERVAQAHRQCVDAAEAERSWFDRLRGCSGGRNAGRATPDQVPLQSVTAERSRLYAFLQELLVVEAYEQYKSVKPHELLITRQPGTRESPGNGYSGSTARDRQVGYERPTSSNSWGPGRTYYR